jgi:hypothetical protein
VGDDDDLLAAIVVRMGVDHALEVITRADRVALAA